jgi:hypothetical protein
MTAISSEAATNSAAAVFGEVEESQTADLTAEDTEPRVVSTQDSALSATSEPIATATRKPEGTDGNGKIETRWAVDNQDVAVALSWRLEKRLTGERCMHGYRL